MSHGETPKETMICGDTPRTRGIMAGRRWKIKCTARHWNMVGVAGEAWGDEERKDEDECDSVLW